MTPDELRKRLLAEVEAQVKEVMSGEGAPQTLSEMEAIALCIGQAVKERVMQELVAATAEPSELVQCESCGGKLKYKGKRQKWVATQAGEAQVERDNKIYALPTHISPDVLKYDATAFENAGVPAPDLTWTVDGFSDTLKQLKPFNGDKPAFVPSNTFGSYLMNLIVAYGGLPIDYRTTPPTINFTDPAAIDAMRQVTDLGKKGYFKYHPLFSGQLDLVMAPEASLIKASVLGMYSLSSLLDNGNNANLKLVMYPRGSKYVPLSYNVGTLYISASSPNPEACYRWISAASKHPNPFTAMPARHSLLDDPALTATQGTETVTVYRQIAALLQESGAVSLPSYSTGTSLNDLVPQLELFKALDQYMAENSSVDLESVLRDAEASAQVFQGCSDTIAPLDMTSTESQKAYFETAKACALKADAALAPFFAGVKPN